MAPALTDAGQSQNFKLPLPHSLPASPINVSPNELNNSPVFHIVSNGICKRDLLFRFNVPEKIFGESKVADIVPEKLNVKEPPDLPGAKYLASETNSIFQNGSVIMNNSDPSMGDQEVNMGIQKQNSTISTLEPGNFLRGKANSDMDQILHNLGAEISSGDLPDSQELSQNVDELLQALSFKGPADVDVTLQDSGPSGTSSSDNLFAMSGTDLTSGLPSFEGELFTDVDMIGMCDAVGLNDNMMGIENKETVTEHQIDDVRNKQFELERKCEFLIRRLRKLQTRTIGKHVNEEIVGVLERAQKLSKQKEVVSEVNVDSVTSETNTQSMKIEGVTALEMKDFVNRLDVLSQQQAAVIARNRSSYKYFGSASDCGLAISACNGPRALPKFSDDTRKELDKVSNQLKTQLQIVGSALDSDMTASSSGGESCDEMQSFNNQHQMPLPIQKRAAWAWARDRAGIACRWAWLQTQISDLEFKIRQQKDIKKQLQISKNHLVFESPSLAATVASVTTGTGTTNTTTRNNHVVVNGFHGILTEALAGKLVQDDEVSGCIRARPLVRSLFRKRKLVQITGLHLVSKKAKKPGTVVCSCKPCTTCAICTGRPDARSNRSFAPDYLTTVPERVALLDSNYHPVLSFPQDMCESNHYDAIMKSAEWQQKTLRSSIKSSKVSGSHVVTTKIEKEAAEPTISMSNHTHDFRSRPQPEIRTKRKYTRRIKKPDSIDGIRPKLPRGRRPKIRFNDGFHRLNRRSSYISRINAVCGGSMESDNSIDNVVQDGIGKQQSPVTSPSLVVTDSSYTTVVIPGSTNFVSSNVDSVISSNSTSSGAHDLPPSPGLSNTHAGISVPGPSGISYDKSQLPRDSSRRKRENSYDIDNIVIPHSMAASTRPERLRYKEIPTPGWRVVEYTTLVRKPAGTKIECGNNGVVRRPSQEEDSDIEDMTDEAYMARHEICLTEERNRFLNFMKLPSYMRFRTSRRADSKAESSGANTPDPMSPSNVEHQGEATVSPITSPPATPLSVTGDSEQPSSISSRRRTVSQSRLARDRERGDGSRCNTPAPDMVDEVIPYEPLSFPLPEETYREMTSVMPPGQLLNLVEPMRTGVSYTCSNMSLTKDSGMYKSESRSSTPSTDSTESAIGDDPNDPEWTVEEAREFDRERRANAKR